MVRGPRTPSETPPSSRSPSPSYMQAIVRSRGGVATTPGRGLPPSAHTAKRPRAPSASDIFYTFITKRRLAAHGEKLPRHINPDDDDDGASESPEPHLPPK